MPAPPLLPPARAGSAPGGRAAIRGRRRLACSAHRPRDEPPPARTRGACRPGPWPRRRRRASGALASWRFLPARAVGNVEIRAPALEAKSQPAQTAPARGPEASDREPEAPRELLVGAGGAGEQADEQRPARL